MRANRYVFVSSCATLRDDTRIAMKIRRAKPDDARGILLAHRSAVREAGPQYYDEELVEAWSPPVDEERIETFVGRNFGEEDESIVFVAIEGKGDEDRVLGFSIVVPDEEKLRAVYVRPNAARNGLGTALLRQAEWAAAQEGAERLVLEASLNAEDFYLEQGYERVDTEALSLGDGLELDCVHMEKQLPGPGL